MPRARAATAVAVSQASRCDRRVRTCSAILRASGSSAGAAQRSLLSRFPDTPVFGPGIEGITGVNTPLAGGETLSLLGESWQVMAVPGHTRGHLAYALGSSTCRLFSGDVLFGFGCGRLFEGTPEQISASLAAIAALILGGRLLLRPALRWIAGSATPEIFTAASLLLVLATAALMQAMRVDPELREYNLRAGDVASTALAEELLEAGRLSREDAKIVARCVLEVNASLIDVWQQAFGGRNARLLGELKQLHCRYLAAYLPEPATPKRRSVARVPTARAK